MLWSDSVSDDDSLELLEERRKTCKALIALHASELHKWEGLKAKVETAIQLKALKIQIAKTPQPTVAEADLLEHYKKLVDSTGKQAPKPEAKTETKAAEPAKPAPEVKAEPKAAEKPAEVKTPAPAPAAKPAETKAEPATAKEPAKPAESAKLAEPEAKPAEPAKPAAAAEPAKPAAEPAKSAEPVKPAAAPAEPAKPAAAPAEPAKPVAEAEAKPAETAAKLSPAKTEAAKSEGEEGSEELAIETPTNLGALGSKPKMRGSTSRAPPTKKADPIVFTPTVVAPSQTEMEEMEKKRAADDVPKKADDTPVKAKKVQNVGFNPLVGMKQTTGPAMKYDKCTECSCDDFSPDTFKKSKCSNCFHVHPASKDQPQPPPTPTAASTAPTPTAAAASKEEEEEQPPPPTTPYPGTPAKTPEAKAEAKDDVSKKGEVSKPPPEPLKTDEALKPPPGTESGGMSPNAKKGMLGAKGFNLGLAPLEAPTEPVVKCKDCGCEDFAPDSFKKTKCSNCFHVHAGAPPPPAAKAAAAKPDEPAGGAVPKCKDCACTSFQPDPFKKSKCANCFHNHV